MRGLAVFLLAAAIILLFCIAVFMFRGQLQDVLSNIFNPQEDQNDQQEIMKPTLEVNVKENSSYWGRNIASDLPELTCNLDVSVTNLGNGSAENVAITTKVDGESYSNDSIALLQPYESYTSSVTITVLYESAKMILAEAWCPISYDSKAFIVNANLSREFNETLCRLFITPEEQSVVAMKNQILQGKVSLTPDWIALRDWVGNNIKYSADSEIHGKREFWQFPNETIQLETGDCEDFAVLLCSLLRADGWSSDSVYVIVGEQNKEYHAWVKIIWNDIQYNIEPQANGFSTFLGDILSLSGYDAKYYFNDNTFGSVQ